MKTAKQLYKSLGSRKLAPHFKKLGWTKQGYSWQYLDEASGNDFDVYVQKYDLDTDEQVNFTIGIDIFKREFIDWHDQFMEVRRSKGKEAPEFTGDKVTDPQDRWFAKLGFTSHWQVKEDTDLEKLGSEIIQDISQCLKPFLDKHKPVNDVMRDLIEKQQSSEDKLYGGSKRDYPKFDVVYYDMLLKKPL